MPKPKLSNQTINKEENLILSKEPQMSSNFSKIGLQLLKLVKQTSDKSNFDLNSFEKLKKVCQNNKNIFLKKSDCKETVKNSKKSAINYQQCQEEIFDPSNKPKRNRSSDNETKNLTRKTSQKQKSLFPKNRMTIELKKLQKRKSQKIVKLTNSKIDQIDEGQNNHTTDSKNRYSLIYNALRNIEVSAPMQFKQICAENAKNTRNYSIKNQIEKNENGQKRVFSPRIGKTKEIKEDNVIMNKMKDIKNKKLSKDKTKSALNLKPQIARVKSAIPLIFQNIENQQNFASNSQQLNDCLNETSEEITKYQTCKQWKQKIDFLNPKFDQNFLSEKIKIKNVIPQNSPEKNKLSHVYNSLKIEFANFPQKFKEFDICFKNFKQILIAKTKKQGIIREFDRLENLFSELEGFCIQECVDYKPTSWNYSDRSKKNRHFEEVGKKNEQKIIKKTTFFKDFSIAKTHFLIQNKIDICHKNTKNCFLEITSPKIIFETQKKIIENQKFDLKFFNIPKFDKKLVSREIDYGIDNISENESKNEKQHHVQIIIKDENKKNIQSIEKINIDAKKKQACPINNFNQTQSDKKIDIYCNSPKFSQKQTNLVKNKNYRRFQEKRPNLNARETPRLSVDMISQDLDRLACFDRNLANSVFCKNSAQQKSLIKNRSLHFIRAMASSMNSLEKNLITNPVENQSNSLSEEKMLCSIFSISENNKILNNKTDEKLFKNMTDRNLGLSHNLFKKFDSVESLVIIDNGREKAKKKINFVKSPNSFIFMDKKKENVRNCVNKMPFLDISSKIVENSIENIQKKVDQIKSPEFLTAKEKLSDIQQEQLCLNPKIDFERRRNLTSSLKIEIEQIFPEKSIFAIDSGKRQNIKSLNELSNKKINEVLIFQNTKLENENERKNIDISELIQHKRIKIEEQVDFNMQDPRYFAIESDIFEVLLDSLLNDTFFKKLFSSFGLFDKKDSERHHQICLNNQKTTKCNDIQLIDTETIRESQQNQNLKTEEVISERTHEEVESTNICYAIRTNYKAINEYIILLIQQTIRTNFKAVLQIADNVFLTNNIRSNLFVFIDKRIDQNNNQITEKNDDFEETFSTLEELILVQ